MSEPRDYRPTVFLPKTDFPMKAGLPEKEPGLLARWEAEGLYQQVREARKGREKFILHDGPPYANGDMHIGHALNHVLKDMVVRTQTLLGKDAPYVPGWDCHGLPIEWKVEEQYRKKKLDKDQVPAKEFRAECRAYAQHWVDVQRAQLKRLGIGGDWDNPYLTMQFDSEAKIVRELLKFAESGQLYRGAKPVMWSPVEKTALAEAEVEYEDIVSTQVDVAFEITKAAYVNSGFENVEGKFDHDRSARVAAWLVGAKAVIWTTTPWTIPINQAIAFGPMPYACLESQGDRLLVARDLVDSFLARTGRTGEVVDVIMGHGMVGLEAKHPMYSLGGFFAEPRRFLPGEFVTTESGTGLVHLAPDHGEDDFELCRLNGIEPKFVVEADGRYREDWGWLPRTDERSMSVINPKFNAPDGPVCSDLREAGALLAASTDYRHSYPHSWRSKAKVIFRCTPQWFVPMDTPLEPSPLQGRGLGEGDVEDIPLCAVEEEIRATDSPRPPTPSPGSEAGPQGQREGEQWTLRQTALAEIDRVRFVPEKGRNRIGSMVAGRPDWVLSRQRAWGVPITLFVDKRTGEYLVDPAVNERIVKAVREHGVDAWSDEAAQELLGNDYRAEDYERIVDILDVWFDSGSTHAFVLESGRWPDLQWPADLYLEGSDQHRGWFQSSLLESCATRGRAPYDAVLTHGFTMASDGKKMSKSLGNTIDPNKVMEQYGADIIRLWALSVDYTEDHRIGDEILKGVADQYRKLRNTFRYMLGALDGFDEGERLPVDEMPELERYVLALLGQLDATLRTAVAEYDFNTYVRALTDFANEDLSAFFFDIRKDSLYCDAPTDPRRRAYRTVLDTLFHALIRYAAPVLVFTAEEVWGTRYPEGGSVHLLEWPEIPPSHADLDRWTFLRDLRTAVFSAAEEARREKLIRSTLEAEVSLVFADEATRSKLEAILRSDAILISEIFISGSVNLLNGNPFEVRQVHWNSDRSIGAVVHKTEYHKCGRCWRLLPEVPDDGGLCARCAEVIEEMDQPA